MVRSIQSLFVLYVGSWFSLLASEQVAAQSVIARQPIDMPGDAIRIDDFGLEDRVPSAIDLIGPEHGAAGRNRSELLQGMQCWIDGVEDCAAADRNDPRVRAIRRFLARATADGPGGVVVHFPDRSLVEVRLMRRTGLGPNAWEEPAYELAVVAESVRAPGLSVVPSRPGDVDEIAPEQHPDIQPALQRLKQRYDDSTGSVHSRRVEAR